MSIAPMMTAVELRFSPSEAMKMAKMRTQRLAPWKRTPLLIWLIVSASSSRSGRALKYPFSALQSVRSFCDISFFEANVYKKLLTSYPPHSPYLTY